MKYTNQEIQGVLDLLQAPILNKDSHKLKGVAQPITSQINQKDRIRDSNARIAAHINISSMLCNEAVLGIIQKIRKEENLSTSAKDSLDCAEALLDITNKANIRGAEIA